MSYNNFVLYCIQMICQLPMNNKLQFIKLWQKIIIPRPKFIRFNQSTESCENRLVVKLHRMIRHQLVLSLQYSLTCCVMAVNQVYDRQVVTSNYVPPVKVSHVHWKSLDSVMKRTHQLHRVLVVTVPAQPDVIGCHQGNKSHRVCYLWLMC